MSAPFAINNAYTSDGYTTALTIKDGPTFVRFAVQIYNAGVVYSIQNVDGSWGADSFLGSAIGVLNRVGRGIRFRSSKAGTPASVTVDCLTPEEIVGGSDTLAPSTLIATPAGGVTRPVDVSLLDTVRFPISAAPQAIPNGVVTNIVWSHLVDWDSNVATFPSIGAPTTQLKVGVTGIYRVGVMIQWANAAGTRLVRPLTSGGADLRIGQWVAAVAGQPTQQTYSADCQIGTGDYITIGVFQDSGGPLNVIDGWATLDRIA